MPHCARGLEYRFAKTTRKGYSVLVLLIGMALTMTISTSARAQSLETLYRFTGRADGGFPTSDLILDGFGNLYGTTYQGGDLNCSNANGFGCGTVFRVTPSGKETALYSFTGDSDGSNPYAGLVPDAAGNGYGTAYQGGDYGCGI